ncbi:MAG: putative selenate ABC transporter substrate-binding protein [Deltaproteobacteria bacterium]|nr:putative selenate ABC transporter substrate-binding protein [Deltaproteobacteria bacterium]MBT6435968.1 putative selenate ABC transporter substrate-binding protein [Deltaproteobacteria bacterium]MBT6489817.1 putative selenate ABC transporter substrate-binding protein [Deltaproteobacteria bacterium]
MKRSFVMNAYVASVLTLAMVACSPKAESEAPAKKVEDKPQAAAEKTVIRVTGIPDENPTELQRKNAPLVAYLSEELGTEVTYVPVTDYGAAVQALAAGQIDFAWLGGFTHVQARTMAGAVPLTMRGIDRDFKTVFIANAQSGVEKVEDIRGKTLSFGSKSSTSGHLMPRHFMKTQFSLDVAADLEGKPVFSGAHDATAKIVESGKVAAGALNKQVWDRMVTQEKVDTAKVKLIWTTPGYVDYVWTAGKEVDALLQDKFKKAFLKLDGTNEKHQAVLALQGAAKFVPAAPSDFDAIESVARETGLLK